MEGSSSNSSSNPPPPGEANEAAAASELETLQKEHEEKTQKIQHLKSQIQALKLRLESKNKNNQSPDDKKQAFNNLIHKYNSLREELLGERSRDHNN